MATTARPLEGMNVLVCDDEPDARDLVCAVLAHAGATVDSAGSAAEALSSLRANPPNVLVSDIGMPHEDGYSLMRRVRALPNGAGRTLAIALTAYTSREDIDRAHAAGFQRHLAKPVDPERLVEALAALVRA